MALLEGIYGIIPTQARGKRGDIGHVAKRNGGCLTYIIRIASDMDKTTLDTYHKLLIPEIIGKNIQDDDFIGNLKETILVLICFYLFILMILFLR